VTASMAWPNFYPLMIEERSTGEVLRVTVPTIGVHALVKFLVGQMLDQLGKDGAAGVHTAFLPSLTLFAGAFN
jgi:hypothetical protein